MSELATAVYDVEKAVERVEAAVKNKWTSLQSLFCYIIGYYVLFILPPSIWHAQWRYAVEYGVASSDVHMDTKPHDCAFLAAPLGAKYCHYERVVSTLRWSTSTTGNPIVSYDEGKTWNIFTPDPKDIVPKFSTVESAYVNWEKKED
jgi:hypothetical protein